MTRPFRQDVNWIQGDKLSYSFTFNQDDSPLDLSGKSEITVVLKNRNTTVFTHTLTGGGITISGASSNKISGSATSTVMDIAARSYDLIVYFEDDPDTQTWVMFDVTIFDENSELNSSASEWTIDIDTTSGTVEGQASQQITLTTELTQEIILTSSQESVELDLNFNTYSHFRLYLNITGSLENIILTASEDGGDTYLSTEIYAWCNSAISLGDVVDRGTFAPNFGEDEYIKIATVNYLTEIIIIFNNEKLRLSAMGDGDGENILFSGSINNTSINAIKLTANSGSFDSGCEFRLYGVR